MGNNDLNNAFVIGLFLSSALIGLLTCCKGDGLKKIFVDICKHFFRTATITLSVLFFISMMKVGSLYAKSPPLKSSIDIFKNNERLFICSSISEDCQETTKKTYKSIEIFRKRFANSKIENEIVLRKDGILTQYFKDGTFVIITRSESMGKKIRSYNTSLSLKNAFLLSDAYIIGSDNSCMKVSEKFMSDFVNVAQKGSYFPNKNVYMINLKGDKFYPLYMSRKECSKMAIQMSSKSTNI